MRVFHWLFVAVPLCVLPAVAVADELPDPDPWEACEQLKQGDKCFSVEGTGFCVDRACTDKPDRTCLYCDPKAMGTTGTATTTAGGTTAASGSSGGESSGGSSDGGSSGSSGASASGTSDGSSPAKTDGCGCRSEGAPAGAAVLLGLVALLRRRRR